MIAKSEKDLKLHQEVMFGGIGKRHFVLGENTMGK